MSETAPVAHQDEPGAPSAPTVDVRALRAAAEAATPGPWSVFTEPRVLNDLGRQEGVREGLLVERRIGTTRNHPQLGGPAPVVTAGVSPYTDPSTTVHIREADAAYIAAFNPATALALLDRLEALEAVLLDVEQFGPRDRIAYCGGCYAPLASDSGVISSHRKTCRLRDLATPELARAALGRLEASRE